MSKVIRKGLQPTKKDNRDFKAEKVFGSISLFEIPNIDFIVSEPIRIKDQKETDYCGGFAGSSVSEAQEGVELDPLYLFSKAKQIQKEWESWGTDLRSIAKAIVKYGTIEQKDSQYDVDKERCFIADWKTWDILLDEKALIHRKRSFFNAGGHNNTFDSIRASLWQYRNKKCLVLTGVVWESEWTNAPYGKIPKEKGGALFGHAIAIIGQKIIQGEPYLVAQLSNGTDIGDNGLFYFPKEVVNRTFNFGAILFIDCNPEEAKQKCWSLFRRWY